MAWTALSFTYGQVLTAAELNNMQANFQALGQQQAGAPLVMLTNSPVPVGGGLYGTGAHSFASIRANSLAVDVFVSNSAALLNQASLNVLDVGSSGRIRALEILSTLLLATDPSSPLYAATKQYVDNLIGEVVHLETVTVTSAVGQVDMETGFDEYAAILYLGMNVEISSDSPVGWRLKTGGTWISSAAGYTRRHWVVNGGGTAHQADGTESEIQFGGNTFGGDPGEGFSFMCLIPSPSDDTEIKMLMSLHHGYLQGGSTQFGMGGGHFNTTEAIEGIRFLGQSVNVNKGVFITVGIGRL